MAKKSKAKKRSHLFLKCFITIVILGLLGAGGYYYYLYTRPAKDILTISKLAKKFPRDEEAPVITADNITIIEGENIDLLKNASVSDNMDSNVKLEVTGEYDNTKPGNYKVTYTATDFFYNTSSKEVVLTVKAKPKATPEDPIIERVDFTTSKGFKGYTENGLTYIDGVLVVNKTYSLPKNYGNGLTKATQNAFNEMKAAALTDGIHLWICSGFRSYNTQKGLYNSYVRRDGKAKADTFSARAGYSEHQTGLAMDINYASSSFNGSPAANWLAANAYKFGFILRYPEGKTNETGYKFESWHYRYVGVDLATKLYNNGNWTTLEDYFGITSQYSN